MSLREVVEAATARPAAVLGLEREVGTLRPGSRADVALFRLYEGELPASGHPRQRRGTPSSCSATRRRSSAAGELERLPPAAGAPWTEEPIWPAVQIPFTEKQRLLRELGRTPDAMAAAAGERV